MTLRTLIVPATVLLAAGPARAATPCDCDHVIEPDMLLVDGSQLGVSAGQSVCVRGGPRPWLRLQKFVGAEGQTIEIRNCEGQVAIDNDDKGYGLTVEASRYVRVTGAGDRDHVYGFKVRAARTGPDYAAMGVAVGDLSSDIEVDHMEVYDSGFAGFMMKTDPRCDGSANLGNFVMHNSKLHHNWIHDTHGEGIYFGSTGYGGREYTCDGMKVILYPHEHHGADIHDNLIERTGWDGAQIGVTPQDCAFYRNTIREVGLAGEMYQQQGLQIGGASACAIWGNVLMDGPTNGIFILGADDTTVYNNLVVSFAETGIYVNDQALDLAAQIKLAHNTVIGSGVRGIAVFGPKLGPGWARNNAVAGSGMQDIGIGGDVADFADEGNQTGDPAALGFVDWMGRDFHLSEGAALRDAGVALPDLMVDDDLEGAPRDDGAPDVGAYEYHLDVGTTGGSTTTGDDPTSGGPGTTGDDPTGGGPTGGGSEGTGGTGGPDATGGPDGTGGSSGAGETSGASDSGGGESEAGGCGCRGGQGAGSAWAALLLLLRRRRSRV
jgi:hypothetical protein